MIESKLIVAIRWFLGYRFVRTVKKVKLLEGSAPVAGTTAIGFQVLEAEYGWVRVRPWWAVWRNP